MATYNTDEQERIDGMKTWWEAYGTTVLIAISVFAASIGGTQAWKYYTHQQKTQAADLYVLVQQVQESEDPNRINDAASLLMDGYSSSGYASRAAMIAAKANFDAGDLKTAKENLQWIINNAEESELKDLSNLRLSGLLLDEEKFDEALKVIASKHGEAFNGLYSDRKGDILTAAGRIAEAREAYQIAIAKLEPSNNYFNIVQMKLDALGEVEVSVE